jgi:acyl carrier protein
MSSADATSLRPRIRAILVEDLHWQDDPDDLTDDLPLIANHVIDSLGLLRLVSRLESEFGIRVADEEVVAANFGSIAQIADFVARTQAPAA